ncbi:Hypothetical predicted protein [Marmota monax]|uniref:Uncharacterized protein n=1 Tax=Marmota monax TaxID=9995 RepID=A0A5E4D138_MARMO|nr:Hypothetical predicted protein [Marmota monax]
MTLSAVMDMFCPQRHTVEVNLATQRPSLPIWCGGEDPGVLKPGKPQAGWLEEGQLLSARWLEPRGPLQAGDSSRPPPDFFLASQNHVNQIAYHSHLLPTFLLTSQHEKSRHGPETQQGGSETQH